MNKVVLSALAALAVSAAPAFAADMPTKAKAMPAPVYVNPWDVAFGTALTTDYVLRGISQSDNKPAVQGYFEVDYTAATWLKLYAGLWGSSLATGEANAEFDISGGGRLTFGNFGLDLGYVYYDYPDGRPNLWGSFGEFYAKPSYKINDWLSIGGTLDGGNHFNDGLGVIGSKTAYYYSGNATITLPWSPAGIAISINPEVGKQVYDAKNFTDYTYWDVGLVFNYKAVTLDVRYWDTNLSGCASPQGHNTCDQRVVATLKFDTTLSALK